MTAPFALLCVDDEPENLAMLKSVLKDTYTVFTAESGRQGLEILRSQTIHAVIADQRMPEMTGLEFFQEIRQTNPDVVLIMVTGYTDLDIVVEAVNNEKINGYFQKPIRAPDLRLLLKKELERLRLARENQMLLLKTLELNKDLQRLNVLKSDFLRMLSHEIRTPLSVILGVIHVMELNPPNPREAYRLFSMIRNQGNTLYHMLDDILYLLEIENVGVTLAPAPVQVKELLEESLATLQQKIQDKALTVELPLDTNRLVVADQTALRRVFSNLLANAIEFSRQGGSIRIRYTPDEKEHTFWFFDTGTGAPQVFHDEVFEKFQPVHSGSTRIVRGTGINLAIAKTLIEAHGGTIGFEHLSDGERAFRFAIPVRPAPAVHLKADSLP